MEASVADARIETVEAVRSDERRRVLREVRALLAAAIDSMIDVFEVDIPETSGGNIWFASIGTVAVRAERDEVACREGAALVRQAIEERLRAALSQLEAGAAEGSSDG